ncbi:MAG: hypothetical protein RI519_02255 [Balneolaceae bacterium]|nr:hypothetical protein [Balneolaceae bacterium]
MNTRLLIGFAVVVMSLMLWNGCERSVVGLEEPSHPATPEVFIDGFSPGLDYAAFSGSVPTAFQVDNDITINQSTASMRFEIPDVGDNRGAYAGGAFFTGDPRDLSGYDALTFWAKASQPANVDVVGFGLDLAASPYQASIGALAVNTNWKKYIIPLPDADALEAERGMFFYSEGPENERGYTLWIDEVQFERLGTIAYQSAGLMDGESVTFETEEGETTQLTGLYTTHSLPGGVTQRVAVSPSYFSFTSSDESVATVNASGVVEIVGSGTASITATFKGMKADGSLEIVSSQIQRPRTAPEAPTYDAADVISMYTNAYTNVPIDTWNTRWQYSTAEETYLKVQEQDVIRYRNLNFAGIEFASQQIDATQMTHFSLDIWTPDPTGGSNEFKVLLVDFGPNGQYGGGDDSSDELTFKAPTLKTGEWVTLDIPLSQFTGLTNRTNMAQLVISGTLPTVYMTNVYFHK